MSVDTLERSSEPADNRPGFATRTQVEELRGKAKQLSETATFLSGMQLGDTFISSKTVDGDTIASYATLVRNPAGNVVMQREVVVQTDGFESFSLALGVARRTGQRSGQGSLDLEKTTYPLEYGATVTATTERGDFTDDHFVGQGDPEQFREGGEMTNGDYNAINTVLDPIIAQLHT